MHAIAITYTDLHPTEGYEVTMFEYIAFDTYWTRGLRVEVFRSIHPTMKVAA
jgi:hypothetical protein